MTDLADVPAVWVRVCPTDRLIRDRGVAARVGDERVAIFVLQDGSVQAIDDRDPFTGAHVLSRGLVGDVAGTPTVASPVYKQRFDLRTGACLDDPDTAVRTWPVRIDSGWIEVGVR